MKIVLIRHGKTKGNMQGRYVGRTDEPLSEEAVISLQEQVTEWKPDLVFVSPMKRCLQTAEVLFPDHEPVIWKGLEERDFGDFEYKNYRELDGNPAYQAFIDSNGEVDFPGSEPLCVFKKRCIYAFEQLIDYAAERGAEQIALVVHGGTIMAVMEAFGEPQQPYFSWQVKNGDRIEGELDDSGKIFIRE